MTVLQVNNDDINGNDSERNVARKRAKTEKDNYRDICAGSFNSPFASRGLAVEARVYVTDVARFESQRVRKNYN